MAQQTYVFYDLETTGLDPAHHRVIQFAALRTDTDLEPLGEPWNLRIRIPDDVIPEPGAMPVHGQSISDMREGITERELARIFEEEVFTPGTLAVGYNNIRFDDRFVYHTLWRSFRDPYAWSYADGRGRWDLFNMVRTFRALSPEGLVWPDRDGYPVNKLEAITEANGIHHQHAHDALSDVMATVDVARLLKTANPALFNHFVNYRHKRDVVATLSREMPALLTVDTRLGPLATAPASLITELSDGNIVVGDMRGDLERVLAYDDIGLKAHLDGNDDDRVLHVIKANSNPGISDMSILSGKPDMVVALDINREQLVNNINRLKGHPGFGQRVRALLEGQIYDVPEDVDAQLYTAFIPQDDHSLMADVVASSDEKLATLAPAFRDRRFVELLFRYRARHILDGLSPDELARWQEHCVTVRQLSEAWHDEWGREYMHADEPLRQRLDDLRQWAEQTPHRHTT